MIEIIYDGNLGNNLFQYCFGRILAENLGYKLVAKPIPGFIGTYDSIDGHDYYGCETLTLRGQKPDLSFLCQKNPRLHILLTGYFQRYEYYEKHVLSIKNWLAIKDTISDCNISADDVVLGIRRGRDYIPRHGLPLSYYENALRTLDYNRVFICTNEPADPFVKYIKKKYRAIVRPPGAIDNLLFIKKFNKIVISNSTFLWWAAFLSNAGEIIFPQPQNGFWSSVEPLSRNINLEVNETRYKYLNCEEYKSEFISERVANFRDSFISSFKGQVRNTVPYYKRRALRVKSTLVFHEEFDEGKY